MARQPDTQLRPATNRPNPAVNLTGTDNADVMLGDANSNTYSSGAGDFKRKRGGIAYLEYTYLTCPFNSYDIKRFILVLVAKKTASLKAQDLIELGA
jgi:hypothetical protein